MFGKGYRKSAPRRRRFFGGPAAPPPELVEPERRKLHCWADGPRTADVEMTTTCMLEHGHDGEHEWTRDDEIRVTFAQGAT